MITISWSGRGFITKAPMSPLVKRMLDSKDPEVTRKLVLGKDGTKIEFEGKTYIMRKGRNA